MGVETIMGGSWSEQTWGAQQQYKHAMGCEEAVPEVSDKIFTYFKIYQQKRQFHRESRTKVTRHREEGK